MNKNFMKDEDTILTKAKEEGIKELWEALKLIALEPEDGGIPKTDIVKIFGQSMDGDLYDILDTLFSIYTPYEAIRLTQIWRRTANLKQGDEIRSIDNPEKKGVVLLPNELGSQTMVLNIDKANLGQLGCQWYSKSAIEKTGKFYPELNLIFEKLRGAAAHD